MALKVGELYATLGMDSAGFDKGLSSAGKGLSDLGGRAMQAGLALTAGITAPIIGLGYAAVKTAGEMEQNRIALTTMLGSAGAAAKFINEIKKFAASTPFEMPGLLSASKQLIAFGFNSEQIIPMMTNLGNAVSSVGGNNETMNRIILQLGQMKTVGKASMEDLRPIAESGIRVFDYLAQGLGKSKAEIMKMMQGGNLGADAAINAIMGGMQNDSKLKGMMDNQSKTFIGMMSNLKDQITNTLEPLGRPLLEIGKKLMDGLKPVLDIAMKLANAFAKLPAPVVAGIVALLGVAAALGPIITAIGGLISGIGAIAGLMGTELGEAALAAAGPIGWVVLGIVAIGAALVFAYNKVKGFRDAVNTAWAQIKQAFGGLWDSIKKLGAALAPLVKMFVGFEKLKMGLAFGALGLVLKMVVALLSRTVDAISQVVSIMAELFTFFAKRPPSGGLINSLLDASIKAVQQAEIQREASKAHVAAVIEASEAEAQGVMDVVEKRRKAAEELRKQQRDAVGFKGITDLWNDAMVSGAKASFGASTQKTETTINNLPGAAELKAIRESTKQQEADQKQLLSIVRQRLGTLPA